MKKISTLPTVKSSNLYDQKSIDAPSLNSFESLYLKKKYKEAVSYLLQNKQQLSSGIFHYNLGTVYSKMGDYPAARFHLEIAIKEGYINSSSLNNLNFVKSQLQVDDLSNSSNFPDQFMNTIISIPTSAFISLSLVLILLCIFLVKSKRIIKKTSVSALIIIAFFPVLFSQFYLSKINSAISIKDVIIYEGPSKIFSEKGKINAGSKVVLGEYKDGWFYVKFPISLAGWINKDQLGLY